MGRKYPGVYERANGKWQWRIWHDGRSLSEGGFDTARKAHEARRKKLTEIESGSWVHPNDLSDEPLGDYLRSWLAQGMPTAEGVEWAVSTRGSYQTHIERYALTHDELMAIPLKKLRETHVRLWHADLLKDGKVGGGALSTSVVRNAHLAVKAAIDLAMQDELIARNPLDKAKPPRKERSTTARRHTWTDEQVVAFIKAMREDPLFEAFRLLFTTGMRRSEISGLQREYLDLEHGFLSVVKTLVVVRNEPVLREYPKSSSSRRRIDLDPVVIEGLRALQVRQAREGLAFGPEYYTEHEYVFRRPDGRPWHPNTYTRRLAKVAQKVGLPKITFHEGRHTAATLLLSKGVQTKIVTELLGHSRGQTTEDLYMHVTPTMTRQATSLLGALVH